MMTTQCGRQQRQKMIPTIKPAQASISAVRCDKAIKPTTWNVLHCLLKHGRIMAYGIWLRCGG